MRRSTKYYQLRISLQLGEGLNLRCTEVLHSEKAEIYEIVNTTKGSPIHPFLGRLANL
jgi:hypothetical protein